MILRNLTNYEKFLMMKNLRINLNLKMKENFEF